MAFGAWGELGCKGGGGRGVVSEVTSREKQILARAIGTQKEI